MAWHGCAQKVCKVSKKKFLKKDGLSCCDMVTPKKVCN